MGLTIGTAVKVFFRASPNDAGIGSEAMWVELTVISPDGKQAVGILRNEPTYVDDLSWGDTVAISLDRNGIWLYPAVNN